MNTDRLRKGRASLAALSLTLFLAQSVLAQTTAVIRIGMTVSDLDRSVAWYSDVLAFEMISEHEVAGTEYEHLQGLFGLRMRKAVLQLGNEQIELTEYLVPKGRPIPIDSRSNDRWFQHIAIIVSDMEKAYARLREHRVEHASSGPQRLPDWNRNAGGIEAFYFKDPDHHVLEVLEFPEGKGAAKWHEPSDRLFLGIDHTALVVADTETSLAFYRDALGFVAAGESENHGVEQEHLNNVFGARLHITNMRPPQGPSVEFLEYLAPTDGRPYPGDTRSNDIVHWETTIATDDVDALANDLLARGYSWISSGVVELPDDSLGFTKAILARDPDGHVIRVIQK